MAIQRIERALAAAHWALGQHLDERGAARLVFVLHEPVDAAVARSAVALVVATGVATLVRGRRSALARFAQVNAAPRLLFDAPASLPVRPARFAIKWPLGACPVLVLAAPGALVHGPEELPIVPARIAIESVVVAAHIVGRALAATHGALGHDLGVGGAAGLVLVLLQPIDAITARCAVPVVVADGVAALAAMAIQRIERALAAAHWALGQHLDERGAARLVFVLHEPVDAAVARSAVALVVATGVATLVRGRRSALARFAQVNAAPRLLFDAPASLPVRPARFAIKWPLGACPVLVLAAPGALVHGPEELPIVPARVAVKGVVPATRRIR